MFPTALCSQIKISRFSLMAVTSVSQAERQHRTFLSHSDGCFIECILNALPCVVCFTAMQSCTRLWKLSQWNHASGETNVDKRLAPHKKICLVWRLCVFFSVLLRVVIKVVAQRRMGTNWPQQKVSSQSGAFRSFVSFSCFCFVSTLLSKTVSLSED